MNRSVVAFTFAILLLAQMGSGIIDSSRAADATVGVISREDAEPATGGEPVVSPPDVKIFAQARKWSAAGACHVDRRDLAFFADLLRNGRRPAVGTGDVEKFVRVAAATFSADCSSVEYSMASGVFSIGLETAVCPEIAHPVVSIMLGASQTEGRGFVLELIDGRLSPEHDDTWASCAATHS